MGVTCRVRHLHTGSSTTTTLSLLYLWKSAVSEQLFIFLEVLHFINHLFRLTKLGSQGLIFHNHNSWWLHFSSTDPRELLPARRKERPCWKNSTISTSQSSPSLPGKCLVPEALNVLVRNEVLDEQVPVVLIELPLLCGQQIVVQGVAGTQRDTLTTSSDQHVCLGEERAQLWRLFSFHLYQGR